MCCVYIIVLGIVWIGLNLVKQELAVEIDRNRGSCCISYDTVVDE